MKTTFASYLYDKKYSEHTIKVYLIKNDRFMAWLQEQGIKAARIDYKRLLQYVKFLHTKKYKRASINGELNAIKQYFDYLVNESYRTDNPAKGLVVKGEQKKVLYNLLSSDILEDLYYSYPTDHKNSFIQASLQRDKVLLGFMVYQGITAQEVCNLQEEHVVLMRGKIIIPSTRKSNSRELELKSWQVLELQHYQQHVRAYLLNYSRTTQNEEQFFYGSKPQINGIITRIIKRVKKYNGEIRNHNHIRSSVIVNWMKQYDDLRKVQYLAGHKHITSTEKYVQDDLENLHEIVNNFHPLH
ncbi:tyrosine-type recombinase/integrase [Aquimarina aggregata]|uniref:tyrosine-type recombinase/integrase n=1 Tax=Aquimarina aggregata TaxID=1642818 RepID=UPI002493524E|nr:tyrosine-type recombinase/integrase [Aquimarina aggregata]